tara:strand:- start:8885 stop:9481 length:597 start_codon:yes stop_codon:yes gene_type:complete
MKIPSSVNIPSPGKILKMKYSFQPILQNQLILYLFLFMTIVQLVIHVNNNDILSIIILSLVGFLTSKFSKNMIVILCVALTVSKMIGMGLSKAGLEGFKGKGKRGEHDDKDEKKKDEKKDKSKKDDEEEELDDAPNSNELSDKTKDEMKRQFEKLKEEYPEFKAIQDDLIEGISKMDPILDKAEAFMNKYSQYKMVKK